MPRSARTSLSAQLYIAFASLTVVGGVFEIAGLRLVAVLLLAGFVALEIGRVPMTQRLVGLLLAGCGLGLGLWQGALPQVALDGSARALQFLVLFAAVAALQVPALRSPALLAVGSAVASQPAGRRFLYVAMGAHLLGAVLNLAGLQLVTSILERGDPALRERMARAMMRGFSAASCWSPLFVSTAVVLSVLPGLSWIDVAPFGLLTGAFLIAMAWSVDRLVRRRGPAQPATAGAPLERSAVFGAATVFLTLLVPVVLLVEAGGLGIAIAIGLVGTIFAVAWQAAIFQRRHAVGDAAALVGRNLATQLPNLRSEVVMFAGASIFGTGIAAVIHGAAGGLLAGLAIPPAAAITGIVMTTILFGLAGLHPVIAVIVIGEALPSATTGLSDLMVAVSLMASWGLATMVSPFSGTAMYLGRVMRLPVWTVSWRWHAAYGVTAGLLLSALLVGLGYSAATP